MNRALWIAATFAGLALAGSPARADRDAAKFFTARAEKSLKAKEWDKAEESFRRALEEDETYLPARVGLAEALIGAGKQAAAVEELRRVVADAEKEPPAPAWKELVAKSKKRLEDIDASGRALQKILDDHVAGLLALAGKTTKEDPEVAERSLRRILKLRPDHKQAAEALVRMGKSPAGDPQAVFNGKNLNGWTGLTPPEFQVRDGCLIAEVHDSAYSGRTESYFKGDFDVLVEMRLIQRFPGFSLFSMTAGHRGHNDWYSLGVMDNGFVFREYNSPSDKREIFSSLLGDLPKPLKAEDWHVYELRFRGGEVIAALDGVVLAKEERSERHGEGFVGVWVQDAKVEFRKIVVVPR